MSRRFIPETESAVPTNSMGASSTSSGPVQTYDPLMSSPLKRKKLSDVIKTKKIRKSQSD